MDFADGCGGQGMQELQRVEAMIDRVHMQIVEIEQQAATAAADEFGEELCFGERRFAELQIAGEMLDEYRSTERRLQGIDARDAEREGFFGERQRQQVVEVHPRVATPA